MKIRFLKAKNWFIVAFLGLMGVSVCSCEKYGTQEDMYGCPTTEYNDSILNQ